MYSLEHRHLPSNNAANRARSRGVRRRVVAGLDGHFRFRRSGWKLEGFRSTEPGALDDLVRNTSTQVGSSATGASFPIHKTPDPASVEDMLQPTRFELYGDFSR